MKIYTRIFPLLILLLLTGCGSKNYFVLVEDPDGSVGEITVSNAKGATTISEANRMVTVKNRKKAPGTTVGISQSRIDSLFGQAVDAQPDPPITFILYFETGTPTLTVDSQQRIPVILETIAARNSVDTSVVGHTDTKGDEQQNNTLSAQRAREIADILISRGVDPAILEITFHGEKNLLVLTGDDVSEPLNRRVEVTVR